MRILLAGSEAVPFAKTGGLADVLGALPAALGALGHETVLVLPLYGAVDRAANGITRTDHRLRARVGADTVDLRVWTAEIPGGKAWLLENDVLFGAEDFYGGADEDIATRFVAFGRGIVELLRAPPDGRAFDIFHGNDWQTGLVPAWLRTTDAGDAALARIGTIFTIHNLAYQGAFPAAIFDLLGIPKKHFTMAELEFFGTVCFLKGGLVFSDILTTVSEKYAEEILTPELGSGLDGLLRERAGDLHGVRNGVDVETWNPETDRHLPARYSAKAISPKDLCRSALMREVGLPRGDDVPLAGIISRFAAQKGLDLVFERLDAILQRVRLVILGSGETKYETRFRDAARQRPDRLSATIGYDDSRAHRIEGGCDLFLMPSVYEPCGLNQIYSLRYGAVPVVRATGGLDDTVFDADADPARGNGFKFTRYDADDFVHAIDRALAARRDPQRWAAIRHRGMTTDFSWSRAAEKYSTLYEAAAARARQR